MLPALEAEPNGEAGRLPANNEQVEGDSDSERASSRALLGMVSKRRSAYGRSPRGLKKDPGGQPLPFPEDQPASLQTAQADPPKTKQSTEKKQSKDKKQDV